MRPFSTSHPPALLRIMRGFRFPHPPWSKIFSSDSLRNVLVSEFFAPQCIFSDGRAISNIWGTGRKASMASARDHVTALGQSAVIKMATIFCVSQCACFENPREISSIFSQTNMLIIAKISHTLSQRYEVNDFHEKSYFYTSEFHKS